jgi:hypothetical protein
MAPGLESLFLAANLFVLPFWALMIFLPYWRVTRRVMSLPVLIAVLPALYVALLLPRLGELLPVLAGQPDLKLVMDLLGTQVGATLGWIHFLALDLFVGRYIYLDNREHQLSAFVVGPILALTFLFGPAGLLAYLLARATVRVRRRRRERRSTPTPAN